MSYVNRYQNGSFRISLIVVRPEKATSKVRVVFDGSAQQNGKCLNSESLPGPKLQIEIVDVLVKFRKEPFALAGDVSQTYHQIFFRPVVRQLHRFLYRILLTGDSPRLYEFQTFILGGCYGHSELHVLSCCCF